MKSPLLDASAGDIVSANLEENTPVMLVTFSVSRWYRGTRQHKVQIETGLGGGDCGFPFQEGNQYLVYTYKDESGHLSTGICTGTARLDDSQSNLAYLRGRDIVPERPKASPRSGSQVCARIVKHKAALPKDVDYRVMLFRVGSTSAIPSVELERDESGNFCASGVDPGEYHMAYAEDVAESTVAFSYYPGVLNLLQATPILIKSGQQTPDIIFTVPSQTAFSVTGVVSTPGSTLRPAETKVFLISADQPFLALAYAQDVASDGTFTFDKVLPGRYWAFVDVDAFAQSGGPKWLTRKTEVVVEKNVSALTLELIPH